MKQSKYNVFTTCTEFPNEKIAYNSRTSAFALLSEVEYQNYMDFINNNKMMTSNIESDFRVGGFILDDNTDELREIIYKSQRNTFSTAHLSLTIAPTTECNFDCIYCYEKKSVKIQTMTLEIQDRIFEYVKGNIKHLETVMITWYGGEPLLQIDTINNLSTRLITLCNDNDVEYSAAIVTNGYLLNPEVVELLNNAKVTTMQITLDGLSDIHDSRRPLIGGLGTFNKILENIVYAADEFLGSINIRINTDKSNTHQIENILVKLKESDLNNKVYPYLGRVSHLNGCYLDSTCLTDISFSSTNFEFHNLLIKHKFSKNMLSKYPFSRSNYCGARTIGFLVVDPEGNLYKCWNDIGISDYVIGKIDNSSFEGNRERFFKYVFDDLNENIKCKNCATLPICMGGCPQQNIDGNYACSEFKYKLEDYLKNMAFDLNEKKNDKK